MCLVRYRNEYPFLLFSYALNVHDNQKNISDLKSKINPRHTGNVGRGFYVDSVVDPVSSCCVHYMLITDMSIDQRLKRWSKLQQRDAVYFL